MVEPNGNSGGLGAGTDGDNRGGKGGSGDNGKGVEDLNSFALFLHNLEEKPTKHTIIRIHIPVTKN
ncbi:hypothetical protein HanXRQr2_Chr13g0618081 [Helianthus annuus]|uniref:Uncharacterized protein n=1 Tax=Helianthus annuus TaxID=4232 RepID=A0A9K3HD57_HELAN|nr:hypothetical protein HanXRQr2_Chr13g0618081 [Helianthus annuus]